MKYLNEWMRTPLSPNMDPFNMANAVSMYFELICSSIVGARKTPITACAILAFTNKAYEDFIKSKSTIKNTKNRRSFIVHIPKYKHVMHAPMDDKLYIV